MTPCPVCAHPCTDPHGCHATCPLPGTPEADETRLLALPHVIRATWPAGCRGCGGWVAERDPMGLRDLPDPTAVRAWVCRRCLAPELDTDVPAPRAPAARPASEGIQR